MRCVTFFYIKGKDDVGIQKKGQKTTSRRYNLLPLLRSRPGGLAGSWPCRTYPGAKVLLFSLLANFFHFFIDWLPFQNAPTTSRSYLVEVDSHAFHSKHGCWKFLLGLAQ